MWCGLPGAARALEQSGYMAVADTPTTSRLPTRPPNEVCHRTGRTVAALVFVCTLALGIPTLVIRQRRPWTIPVMDPKVLGDACNSGEHGVDYLTKVSLDFTNEVETAAHCRARCLKSRECGVWTWHGDNHMEAGLTKVCLLKRVELAEVPKKYTRHGAVSGLICRGSHPQLLEAAAAAPSTDGGDSSRLCENVDDDMDYWTSSALGQVEHIASAEDCRKECEGWQGALCKAWTWGKIRGVEGFSDVCFIKHVEENEEIEKRSKVGVQSGIPCARPTYPTSTSSTSTTEESTSTAVTTVTTVSTATTTTPKATTTTATTTTEEADSTATATTGKDCGRAEDDIFYPASKALRQVEGIASADDCEEKCTSEPRCATWTWGRTRGVEGLSDVCFLKSLEDGELANKKAREGVTSGMPCRGSGMLRDQLTIDGDDTDDTGTVTTLEPTTTLPQRYPPGSLLCFALIRPAGYEPVLLRFMRERRLSVFACDESAVYSNESVVLAPDLRTSVINISLECKSGGEFKTALNRKIFMAVWTHLINEGRFKLHSWTVKVDPDTVFFPSRLSLMLQEHIETDAGVYLNNCKLGLHGPVEVLSRNAVLTWGKGAEHCVRHFHRLCSGPCYWGEDLFIDQCLWKVLNVQRDNEYRMLSEDHCYPPKGWDSCRDAEKAAFHPFKSVKDYQDCVRRAAESHGEGGSRGMSTFNRL